MAFMHFGNFLEGMRLSAADIADREKSELNRRYMDEQMQTMQLAREMNRDELNYRPELRARDAERFGMDRTQFTTDQTSRELALAMNPAIAGIEADLNPASVQAAIDANITARKKLGLPVDPALEGLRVSAGKDGAFVFTPRGGQAAMQGPALTRPGAPAFDPVTGRVSEGAPVEAPGPSVQVSYDGNPAIVPRENAREFVYKLWTGKESPEKAAERGLADARARSGGGSAGGSVKPNKAWEALSVSRMGAEAKLNAAQQKLTSIDTMVLGKTADGRKQLEKMQQDIATARAELAAVKTQISRTPIGYLGEFAVMEDNRLVPIGQVGGFTPRPDQPPAPNDTQNIDALLQRLMSLTPTK